MGWLGVTALRWRAHRPVVEGVPAYRHYGARDAKIVITEFSDFQCPACRMAAEAVRSVKARHAKKVTLVFRHKPLTKIHPHAFLAAQAAECVGRQGKFWEYHDLLFQRQREWTAAPDVKAALVELAADLGLDRAGMQACLGNPETVRPIMKDIDAAEQKSVNATPTFLVNEDRCVGARQFLTRCLPDIRRKLGEAE